MPIRWTAKARIQNDDRQISGRFDITTILFLNAWSPFERRPTKFLKIYGHTIINSTFNDHEFDGPLTTSQTAFDRHQPHVIISGSRGGTFALTINSGDANHIFFAPPWKNWSRVANIKPGTVILLSRADEIIPCDDSVKMANVSETMFIEPGRANLEVRGACYVLN